MTESDVTLRIPVKETTIEYMDGESEIIQFTEYSDENGVRNFRLIENADVRVAHTRTGEAYPEWSAAEEETPSVPHVNVRRFNSPEECEPIEITKTVGCKSSYNLKMVQQTWGEHLE